MKKQGYLYWGNVPDNSSISGKRPFLVLSKEQTNKAYVTVAPLRSVKTASNHQIPIRKDNYPIKDGIILLDQICTIKTEYLLDEISVLRQEELIKVKEILNSILL